jgi:hypothetical protein
VCVHAHVVGTGHSSTTKSVCVTLQEENEWEVCMTKAVLEQCGK